MSKGHKDLPAGSQPWANEVDKAMARIAELEAIVRRLTENAGIDMSNPKRGINTGDTPNVKSPVAQKLSSLADVDTYNVLDGQVPAWSGKDQKWLPVKQTGGMEMRPATDEEQLEGYLNIDGDYYTSKVFGYQHSEKIEGWGNIDSYGLVGTSDSSAFLHASGYWGGPPQRFHGYVGVHPYYVHIGSQWIDDDTGQWTEYGEIMVGRGDIWLTTPLGQQYSWQDPSTEDGMIFHRTNWFYPPIVNDPSGQYGPTRPRRPVPYGTSQPSAGAMCYDHTLKKPIFWNGTKWVDAMGNDIPAALY